MRLPVTTNVSTKDSVSAKNARLTNCLKETSKRGDKAVVRPGLVAAGDFPGIGNGLIPFDGRLLVISDDTITDESGDLWPWPLDSLPWASGTTYGAGDSAWYNGVLWFSLAAGNTGHTPGSGSAYWATSYVYSAPPAATTELSIYMGAGTLSGGNLILTVPSGGFALSRSTTKRGISIPGKYYCEITCNSTLSPTIVKIDQPAGLVNLSAGDIGGVSIDSTDGFNVYCNVYVNGVFVIGGNSTGANLYMKMAQFEESQITVNFGNTPFTYLPSGFSMWG